MDTGNFLLDKLGNLFLTHIDFLFGLIFICCVLYLIFKIIDIINMRILFKLRRKVTDYPMLTIIPISLRALKFVIACVFLAIFLQHQGYNVTSIIAGLGIVGLAVGFAAQTTIGNVFGSFSLLIDKVYKIGDYIKFEDKSGFVENINLRSTTFRTQEGYLMNVPNNLLANMPIVNVSQTSKYKMDIKIAIELSTPANNITKALNIMQNSIANEELIEPNGLAFLESVEDTAINLRLIAYTHGTGWTEYMNLRTKILTDIINLFQKEGIDFDVPDSRISFDDKTKLFG